MCLMCVMNVLCRGQVIDVENSENCYPVLKNGRWKLENLLKIEDFWYVQMIVNVV